MSSTNSSKFTAANTYTISEDEKAVYDRQIRLWGLETQNRLRSSTVLVAGLSGCGSEVSKNLMLTGLKSLTLLDNKTICADDYCSQFLLQRGSEGKNRAEASRQKCQLLNPNVELHVDTGDISEKDEKFFTNFDLIILVDQKYAVINQINKICRNARKPFIAGGVFGWIGYAFFDFTGCSFLVTVPKVRTGDILEDDSVGDHSSPAKKRRIGSEVENGKGGEENKTSVNVVLDDDEKVHMTFSYPLWDDAWNVDWTHKRLIRKAKQILPRSYFPVRVMLRLQDSNDTVEQEKFIEMWKKELEQCNHMLDDEYFNVKYFSHFVGPQLSPTCAIVGAHIAQEAIKALSQKDDPLRNVFFYSAIDTSGIVCHLPPIT
uniref:THIF-type NAD/FAD binding fold domain-containing protein n=2 Tax=Wuchereria bancrofti TaxID=6293 RepID=A0AAF5PSR5_WUCBA